MDSRSIKMSFLGYSGSGKSALLSKLRTGTYPENLRSTAGADFLRKPITLNDEKIKLETWDVSGQERFESVLSAYVNDRDFVVVFCEKDNDNRKKSIQHYINLIQASNPSVPIFILLTKSDLKKDEKDFPDVNQLISETRHCKFLGEISAKDNTQEEIEALFHKAILEFKQTPLQDFLEAHAKKTKEKHRIFSFFHRTHITPTTTLAEAILDARHKKSSTANQVFVQKQWLKDGVVLCSAPKEMKDAEQEIRSNQLVFKK